MSLNVLVVPENPKYNGYILKPLVERIMKACARPRSDVTIMTNPSANGYEDATKLIKEQVPLRYRHVKLVLFLPDNDGQSRRADLDALEKHAKKNGIRLLCCAAVEEVETWLLAGHVGKLGRPWLEVRRDSGVKESFFQPFVAQHGNPDDPGGSRRRLMKETLRNYRGLKSRCPEIAELEERIRNIIAAENL